MQASAQNLLCFLCRLTVIRTDLLNVFQVPGNSWLNYSSDWVEKKYLIAVNGTGTQKYFSDASKRSGSHHMVSADGALEYLPHWTVSSWRPEATSKHACCPHRAQHCLHAEHVHWITWHTMLPVDSHEFSISFTSIIRSRDTLTQGSWVSVHSFQ